MSRACLSRACLSRAGLGQGLGRAGGHGLSVVEQGMALSGARFGQGLGRGWAWPSRKWFLSRTSLRRAGVEQGLVGLPCWAL